MGKQSGLGQRLYVAGYDISGDIIELGTVASPVATLDTTGIDKSAMERTQGKKDGALEVTAWFNPENVSSIQEHAVYSTLPTTDVLNCFVASPVSIGAETYCIVGKQVNYDPKRADSGEFTFGVSAQANGYGGEWGKLLTAGKRTDSGATAGTSYDQTTVSTSFGWQAYLQVFAFAGTDATVKVQDSADNSSFADLTGAAFTPSPRRRRARNDSSRHRGPPRCASTSRSPRRRRPASPTWCSPSCSSATCPRPLSRNMRGNHVRHESQSAVAAPSAQDLRRASRHA